MEKKCLKINRIKENPTARLVKIGGIISNVKKIITKNGKPMLFMGLEDLTDKIEVVVFARALEKIRWFAKKVKLYMFMVG